jgi:HSP20 family molecular chaperone IbpA
LLSPGDVADEETRGGYVHWLVAASWAVPAAADVRRRFDELIHSRWQPRAGTEPPADVFLVGEELWIQVDLPGVEESQVQVRLEAGELIIEARREPDPSTRDAPALQRERMPGTLRRRLHLPRTPAHPALEVRCEAGVLRVRIWAREEPGA